MEHGVGDDRHHHHLEDFALLLPQVQDAVAEVGDGSEPSFGSLGHRGGVPQPHRHQKEHHGEIEGALQGEVPEVAQPEDEQSADEGAEDTGAGYCQHIDGIGVAYRLAGHGVGDEHLLQGLGYGQEGARDEDIGVGVPGSDVFAVDEEGEPEGEDRTHPLYRHHQLAAVEPVPQHAGERVDKEAREGVDGANADHQQAAYLGVRGQVLDQPPHAQQLQPRCRVGTEVGAPKQPEVREAEERVEGLEPREPA